MTYEYEEGNGYGFLEENAMKYNIKDSVFRMLFSTPRFRLELYRALFPDQQDVREEDLEDATIANYLINGRHNDIAIRKGNELLILAEAQDTWSLNILIRMLFYVAEILERIVDEDERMVFKAAKAEMLEPVFYVIYTGQNKNVRDEYSLADEFFPRARMLDLKVRVLRRGVKRGDIVDQYVEFTRRVHAIIREKGLRNISPEDITALVRECIRDGILAEFLSDRLPEVTTLMESIFNENYFLKCVRSDGFDEGKAEGKAEGLEEGKKEGRLEERIAMAKNLLLANVDLAIISKTTGFKPDYIISLA